MKNNYILALASAFFFFGSVGVKAQTILDEDFETENTDAENNITRPVAVDEGWTTIDSYSGSELRYNWSNYFYDKGTIGGKHVAMCDGPISADFAPEAAKPREEILLSPELDLNNTYQLSFDWKVSPMAATAKSMYDLQVRVVVDGDVANAETIFSIQNKEDLKESGVSEWPLSTWDTHTSKLDLSDWKGKKIKLAFVYKMYTTIANIVYLDNVKVKKFTPATSPVAKLNKTTYSYGDVYIGEKFYSDAFTLTNTGLKGLQITSVDLPEGVGLTIDPSAVNLDKAESVKFNVSYTASITSSATPKVVLHTNGGDLTINLKANKKMAPDGLTEETFEVAFPPAGWQNDGWSKSNGGLEGDVSVYASGSYSDQYITSPRLDLTKGGKVQFSYYNQYDTEETDEDGNGVAQSNDITLDLSTDGGKTWKAVWTFDYKKGTYGETTTVDLGTATDNSYVRWHNTAITSNDGDVDPYSSFYLDRVFLPALYGQEGTPFAATLVAPADSLTNVYNQNIELKWGPALFAEGYKLYVGTSENVYNVVDGLDLKDALSYTLATAEYETMYYWKVVPYNEKGASTQATVWHFTTQKDASTSEFPYTQDFSGVTTDLPTGWISTNTTQYANRSWSVLKDKGTPAPCLFNMWLDKGNQAFVTTPEFKLPTDKNMSISFDWVDCHPVNAKFDQLGNAKKQNTEGAPTTVTFEVLVDGAWKQLSYISQGLDEDVDPIYWINEKIDLSAYAGKTVQFRWTHTANNGNDNGCGLDNVVIEENVSDKAVFNKEGWNAGKANYNKGTNSGDIFTILNKGEQALKVKSVSFATDNFASSITPGTEIAKGESLTFSLQFYAKDVQSTVNDNMTVTFESGYSVQFPVEGTALASDVLYYSFEDNDLDYNWTTDFNLIDVDRSATVPFNCYGTEFPSNNGVYAFAVAYERPDHKNVAPISGDAFIIPGSPLNETTKGDNWIVSKKLTATAESEFDFYARNWESKQSILPSGLHRVEVLVSETSNTDRNSFKTVLNQQEIPLLDHEDWKHYTVNLSAYAGKDIYVAVRDYTERYALAAFYDDFTFSHFDNVATGIKSVQNAVSAADAVAVYNLNGMKVAQGNGMATLNGLAKGVYVVKVQTADGVKTMKVARK